MKKISILKKKMSDDVSLDEKIDYLRKRGHSNRGIGYMGNNEIYNWYKYYHDNPNAKSPHELMLERHKRQREMKKILSKKSSLY